MVQVLAQVTARRLLVALTMAHVAPRFLGISRRLRPSPSSTSVMAPRRGCRSCPLWLVMQMCGWRSTQR